MNPTLKIILAAVLPVLAPEAKALFEANVKPFVDKEVALTGGDWHTIATIMEPALIQVGEVELAAGLVKLTQIAGASA